MVVACPFSTLLLQRVQRSCWLSRMSASSGGNKKRESEPQPKDQPTPAKAKPMTHMTPPSSTSKAHHRLTNGGACVGVASRHAHLLQLSRLVVPKLLSSSLHKGSCGRICVFGGCVLYTGAPFFAALSALRTGADLVHVFCEKAAAPVIKSYSPELIVHPVLDSDYAVEEIDAWLTKCHAVVVGPGLGRNQAVAARIAIAIEKVRSLNLPLVIDADGLWHLNVASNLQLIRHYRRAVLTPNAVEFARLASNVLHSKVDVEAVRVDGEELVRRVANKLGGVTVLLKGQVDVVSDGKHLEVVAEEGCPRRCGGQGDLLAGACSVFLHWSHHMLCSSSSSSSSDPSPSVLSAWAAARLTRACAAQGFASRGRAVLASDLIDHIDTAFHRLYETETSL